MEMLRYSINDNYPLGLKCTPPYGEGRSGRCLPAEWCGRLRVGALKSKGHSRDFSRTLYAATPCIGAPFTTTPTTRRPCRAVKACS